MKSMHLILLIGCSTLFVVLTIILIIVLIYVRRSKRKAKQRKLSEEEVGHFLYGSSLSHPNDPNALVNCQPFNSALEIPRNLLEFDEKDVINPGKHGVVTLRGFLKLDYGGKQGVAVKMVDPSIDTENFNELLSDLKIMGHLEAHENILSLLGVCTAGIRERKIFAAVEFCSNGNLHDFLQKNRNQFVNLFSSPRNSSKAHSYVNIQNSEPEDSPFSTMELLQFSCGIANAMSYLSRKNVIHGQLTARNVLLTERLQVKISGFGFSPHIAETAECLHLRQGNQAWKWMAFESLKTLKFSVETEVWTYGIVIWEIFSLGEHPYQGFASLQDSNFLEQIILGYRLKRPEYANRGVYNVMLDCWHIDPQKRPSFNLIHSRILHMIDDLKQFVVVS